MKSQNKRVKLEYCNKMRKLFVLFLIVLLLITLQCNIGVSAHRFCESEVSECDELDDFCLDISDEDEYDCFVETALGAVHGVQLATIFEDQSFCAFRGIPYAKAPTGSRRFRVISVQIIHLLIFT